MNRRIIPAIPRYRAALNTTRFVSDPIGMMNQNIGRYGDTFYSFIGGMHPAVISANPHFLQHVLQKNHRNYRKSPIHFDKLGRFLGNGLLTSDGDYWLRQRRLIQPGFHRHRLQALTGLMLQQIEGFCEQLDQSVREHESVDIAYQMMSLAFRIVARSLFSTELNEAELALLSRHITHLQAFMARTIRQPYLEPWFRLSGRMAHHHRIAEDSKAVIRRYIQNRKESGEVQDDLLQMLLDARYEDTGEGMTDEQLLEESLILFVAGHETTANALAWTWYLLSRRPQVVQRLRNELATLLGTADPTFDDLPRLTYTQQVIEESLRLYPPAWVTDRLAIEADEADGVNVDPGMIVVAYIYGAHHHPRYWEDPETFRPERFEKEKKKKQHPFAFLPFGGGPRLCIGNNFAMMEMQLILAQLIRRYDFELLPGQEIDMQPLITLRPRHGIRFAVRRHR